MEAPPAADPSATGSLRAPRVVRNWIGLTGAVLSGSAVFAFLLLFAIDIFAKHANPYMGILAYVVAPGFFFLGVGLIVFGYRLQRRHRLKTTGESVPLAFSIDLSRKRDRRLLGFFSAGSIGFLLLTAFGSYQSYHLTETVTFCGEACHEPMEPQYSTYRHSQHARVDCVACHVGPGATEYVRTKVNGVRQLYHTIMGDFDRPIRLLDRNRRPTEVTCESCHWREKFTGDLEKTFHRFLADETNTPFSVRMILNVGGGDPVRGPVEGIHWHMNLANRIEFIGGDDKSTSIPWVRMTDADGKVTVFKTPDFDDDPANHRIHTMDCMDCHNRPAHKFLSPNDAVDQSLHAGRIDRSIPWAKMKAVDALSRPYKTRAEALDKIGSYLRAEYQGDDRADAFIAEVREIYQRNFFPEMKADWRTYPDHISHKDWAGCFRCHDGSHKSEDGRTIKASDCTSCHLILAQGGPDEMLNLNAKGHDFLHVDAEYEGFDCFECHTGTNQE